MINYSRLIVRYLRSAVMTASSTLHLVVFPIRAAVSRGHIREDEWFGRPSCGNALTTHDPGYFAQMYWKEPHVPSVTSVRILAEGTGV
jgi:hypothetical protein